MQSSDMIPAISAIQPTPKERTNIWRTWLPLGLILAVALGMRIGYLPTLAFRSDMAYNSIRASIVYHDGLFNLYNASSTDYPPIYMAMLGIFASIQAGRGLLLEPAERLLNDPGFVILLKLVPLLSELALIAAVYAWVRRLHWTALLIPLALALYPGLILNSAWWGQTDSLMTLLLILALIALNRDKPRCAWAFFAIAMLTKYQSVVLLPVLGILTLRRYGWRTTLAGIVIVAGLMAALLTPFILASGLDKALSPYTNTLGSYPSVTVNAFNVWYAVSPHPAGNALPWPDNIVLDSTPFFGAISDKLFGVAMLGLYVLALVVSMWRRADQHLEFVWAAAIYFAFFMLPTEIHERYLYPAAVFLVIGIIQDRRLWPVAVGTAYTFTYNLIRVTDGSWLGFYVWPRNGAVAASLINIGLLFELTRIALTKPTYRPGILMRLGWGVIRVATGLAVASLILVGASEFLTYYSTVHWLQNNVATYSQVVTERFEVVPLTKDSADAQTWNWQLTSSIEAQPVGAWLGAGSHYLVVDERTYPDENFDQRLKALTDQGATLIYQSPGAAGFAWREAVLWTFRPQVPLNLMFDNSLLLTGYDVLEDGNLKAGTDRTSVRFYWYVRQPTPFAFNIFIHLIDPVIDPASGPTEGEIAGQADRPLGDVTHTSNSWRKGEIVFQVIDLPSEMLHRLKCPYTLRVGLYRLENGQRATMSDAQKHIIGDHVDLRLDACQPQKIGPF